jgi:twitching motility protein PilT
VEANCSDLHLKVGLPPRIRVDGSLADTPFERFSPEGLESLSRVLVPAERAEEFAETNETDFALSVKGIGRFRCNVFRQRGSVGMVLRRVATTIPAIQDLGLPPVVARLASEHRGLVLVTGPTGSGKTSTLASMIDHINATQAVNIVRPTRRRRSTGSSIFFLPSSITRSA